jgi:hypothetical protein
MKVCSLAVVALLAAAAGPACRVAAEAETVDAINNVNERASLADDAEARQLKAGAAAKGSSYSYSYSSYSPLSYYSGSSSSSSYSYVNYYAGYSSSWYVPPTARVVLRACLTTALPCLPALLHPASSCGTLASAGLTPLEPRRCRYVLRSSFCAARITSPPRLPPLPLRRQNEWADDGCCCCCVRRQMRTHRDDSYGGVSYDDSSYYSGGFSYGDWYDWDYGASWYDDYSWYNVYDAYEYSG